MERGEGVTYLPVGRSHVRILQSMEEEINQRPSGLNAFNNRGNKEVTTTLPPSHYTLLTVSVILLE